MSIHEDEQVVDGTENDFEDALDELPITFLIKFIKKFDGNREELSSFLADCGRAFDLATTRQKQILLDYVITQISGKAKAACVNRSFLEWKDLKAYLRTMYADTKHKSQLLCELTTLRQTADESLSNFTCRMEACLKRTINSLTSDNDPKLDPSVLDGKLQMLQEIALNRFTYFTSPAISNALRIREIKTLNDAITIAKAEEQIQKMVVGTKNPKLSGKNCNYCKKPGHLIGECRKRQFNNSNPKNTKSVNSLESKPAESKASEVCKYCKKKGHLIKDCYKRKNNDSKTAEAKSPNPNSDSNPKNSNARPTGSEGERWYVVNDVLMRLLQP